MKKKLLIIVPLLLLTGTVVYQTTSALFSDTERTEDSTFTAGTLDMNVDGENGVAFENIVVSNIGVDGVVNGTKTWTINNTGSVPGNLSFSVLQVRNYDNACNEPEALVDTTCADPGLGEGELGVAVSTLVSLDQGSGFLPVVTSDLATASEGQYASQWNASPNAGTAVTIPAGGSVQVKMDWLTDPSAYGNEIQSDSLDFDIQFDLVQVLPV